MPEEELEPYYKDANALMMKLERMPPAVRARLQRIEIRCPVKGCLLATVYWMLRRPTAKELEWDRHERPRRAAHGIPAELQSHQRGYFLYVGRTAGGTEVYDILNYLPPRRTLPQQLHPLLAGRVPPRHRLDRSRFIHTCSALPRGGIISGRPRRRHRAAPRASAALLG